MLEFWIQIAPVIVLLILGFSVGTIVERLHFRRLKARESALGDMVITDLKTVSSAGSCRTVGMVTGEVVIASDYFKTFAASLRKLIGGELRTFETLMERARREALLRMAESARRLGANHVINVRFATSNIGSMRRKRQAAMVEMYAYGTAMHVSNPPES